MMNRTLCYLQLLQLLKAHRVTAGWLEEATSDHTHSMFTCLRLLLRDDKYQVCPIKFKYTFTDSLNTLRMIQKRLVEH